MSRREKLIQSIKNNPKNVDFEDIKNLLLFYGCSIRQKRTGSSHFIFTHNAIDYHLPIPKEKPIKAVYARKALKMVEDIKEGINNE